MSSDEARNLNVYVAHEGLSYCANLMSTPEEIICAGGGALCMFYDYPENTVDLDSFNMHTCDRTISDEIYAYAREFAHNSFTGVAVRWLNSDIIEVTHPFVFDEYLKHVNYNVTPFEYFNQAHEKMIVLRPVTIEFIYKTKILMDSRKEEKHLRYIEQYLGITDFETAMNAIMPEDPSFVQHQHYDLFVYILQRRFNY